MRWSLHVCSDHPRVDANQLPAANHQAILRQGWGPDDLSSPRRKHPLLVRSAPENSADKALLFLAMCPLDECAPEAVEVQHTSRNRQSAGISRSSSSRTTPRALVPVFLLHPYHFCEVRKLAQRRRQCMTRKLIQLFDAHQCCRCVARFVANLLQFIRVSLSGPRHPDSRPKLPAAAAMRDCREAASSAT
jgi:hypothetical protein